jgi:hypothetical protein
MDTGTKQGLAGINVADAHHDALIHQKAFDGRRAPPARLEEIAPQLSRSGLERLRSEISE